MHLFHYSNKVTDISLHCYARDVNVYMYLAARMKNVRYILAVHCLPSTHYNENTQPSRTDILKRIIRNDDHRTLDTLLYAWTEYDISAYLQRYFQSHDNIECLRVYAKHYRSEILVYARYHGWQVSADTVTVLLEDNTVDLTPQDAERILQVRRDDFVNDKLTKYIISIIVDYTTDEFIGYLCRHDISALFKSGVPLPPTVLIHAVNHKRIDLVKAFLNNAKNVADTDTLHKAFANASPHTDPSIALLLLTRITERIRLRSIAQYSQSDEVMHAVLKKWSYTKDEMNDALSIAAESMNFYVLPSLIDMTDVDVLTGNKYNLVMCIIENRRLATENRLLKQQLHTQQSIVKGSFY